MAWSLWRTPSSGSLPWHPYLKELTSHLPPSLFPSFCLTPSLPSPLSDSDNCFCFALRCSVVSVSLQEEDKPWDSGNMSLDLWESTEESTEEAETHGNSAKLRTNKGASSKSTNSCLQKKWTLICRTPTNKRKPRHHLFLLKICLSLAIVLQISWCFGPYH